jgi:hypothetical protein
MAVRSRLVGIALVALVAGGCRFATSPDATITSEASPIDTTAPSGWQRFEWPGGDASIWGPPGWTQANDDKGLTVDASPQPADPALPKFLVLSVDFDARQSPGDYSWYDPVFARGDWVQLPAGLARHVRISRGSMSQDVFLVPRDARESGRLYSLSLTMADPAEALAIAETLRFGLGLSGS